MAMYTYSLNFNVITAMNDIVKTGHWKQDTGGRSQGEEDWKGSRESSLKGKMKVAAPSSREDMSGPSFLQ